MGHLRSLLLHLWLVLLSYARSSRACSGGEDRAHLAVRARLLGNRFQLEGVAASRNQGEGNRVVGPAMEIFGFEPGAEPGIVNFWLSVPEVGLEAALDAKVPEL